MPNGKRLFVSTSLGNFFLFEANKKRNKGGLLILVTTSFAFSFPLLSAYVNSGVKSETCSIYSRSSLHFYTHNKALEQRF